MTEMVLEAICKIEMAAHEKTKKFQESLSWPGQERDRATSRNLFGQIW